MSGALSKLDQRIDASAKSEVPKIASFEQFLMEYAQVRKPDGTFIPYSLKGRESLLSAVRVIDHVLGSHTGVMIKDSSSQYRTC